MTTDTTEAGLEALIVHHLTTEAVHVERASAVTCSRHIVANVDAIR